MHFYFALGTINVMQGFLFCRLFHGERATSFPSSNIKAHKPPSLLQTCRGSIYHETWGIDHSGIDKAALIKDAEIAGTVYPFFGRYSSDSNARIGLHRCALAFIRIDESRRSRTCPVQFRRSQTERQHKQSQRRSGIPWCHRYFRIRRPLFRRQYLKSLTLVFNVINVSRSFALIFIDSINMPWNHWHILMSSVCLSMLKPFTFIDVINMTSWSHWHTLMSSMFLEVTDICWCHQYVLKSMLYIDVINMPVNIEVIHIHWCYLISMCFEVI